MLLAIGLAALLCVSMTRPGSIQGNDATTISGGVVAESQSPHESDRQWLAQRRTIAAVTESIWKSAPVHAALAGTASARSCDTSAAAASAASPLHSAPSYLRHTPLLI
jgi:hypothetical protein